MKNCKADLCQKGQWTQPGCRSAKTLAKYMGDLNRVYYADWIIEYIKKDSLIEKE